MIVNFVMQCGFSNLIQAGGLVQIHGVTIRHDETVEDYGQPFLADIIDFFDFA